MININTALQKAYIAAFAGISYDSVGIKSFYQNKPDNINDEVTIIILPALMFLFG